MSDVHVFGGGTFFHVRPHLALAAPAFGATARRIASILVGERGVDAELHLTRMAGGDLDTNEDVARALDALVANPTTKIIFLSTALCDYEGHVVEHGVPTASGKREPRLRTIEGPRELALTVAEKIIGRVRRARKDIFLVGFKTTTGADLRTQYEAGLDLLKKTSCNLVFCNDLHTRMNLVVTPELAHYHETTDRESALAGLVALTLRRSALTFTRTTLTPGALVAWTSDAVPTALRTVVDHCVARGAYRPFNNVTVGHFAFKDGAELVSSRRKQNYNVAGGRDMVRVSFDGEQTIAHGAKPSAGTTSQRAVLAAFPDMECIVHFHCPLRAGSDVPVRAQYDFECGSRECGENTRIGMRRFGELAAVMLDRHGPNIVFRRDVDPRAVIEFIEQNFDLAAASADAFALSA